MNKLETNPGSSAPDTADNSWDMSDVEFSDTPNTNITLSSTDNVIESQSSEIKADTLEDLEFWSNEYRQTEIQFSKFQKSTKNLNHDKNYYQQLSAYEADQAYNWQRLTESTNSARSHGEVQDDYILARVQQLRAVEPAETIEAASGAFFTERMANLRGAINNASDNAQEERDLKFINNTWQRVYDYITAATDYESMHESHSQYQLVRRSRHNEMIKQLNGLNQLAEAYGTPRFTLRNFMTNDFYYRQANDKGGWLNIRANYDRETVLSYFKTVYADRIGQFERSAREIDLFPSRDY